MSESIWKVKSVIPENQDVTSLVLEDGAGGRDKFDLREPGQFASISVKTEDGWTEPHPFTISGAPEDESLRFTIKKSGEFTSTIPDIKPGTEVMCAGPFGVFCKDIDRQEEIVMIAGGVGITPFLSVLRHFSKTGARNRVTLFWANKTLADAFALEELAGLSEKLDLKIIAVLSRDEPPADNPFPKSVVFESGRVTRELFEKYVKSVSASFYLCGPPPMQDAVIEELSASGVDKDDIRKEAFNFVSKGRK